MYFIKLVIKIEDIPEIDRYKNEKFLSLMEEDMNFQFTDKSYIILKDHWSFFFSLDNINLFKYIKGPKMDSVAVENFKNKYINCEFENKENFIYAKYPLSLLEQIEKALIYALNNISWSIYMKWNNFNISCCRPIQQLSIYINEQLEKKQLINIPDTKYLIDFKNNLQENKLEELRPLISLDIYEKITKMQYLFKKMNFVFITVNDKFLTICKYILKNYIEKEFNSFFIIDKDSIYFKKILVLFEHKENLNKENLIKKITFSLESKLLDLWQQHDRDLNKEIAYYKNINNNLFISKNLGHLNERKNRILILIQDIFNKADLAIINLFLEYYEFDMGSEVIQEFPENKGFMALSILKKNALLNDSDYNNLKDFYKKNLSNLNIKYFYICEAIDQLLCYESYLPIQDNDAFGLKACTDFIIEDLEILKFILKYLSEKYGNQNKVYLYCLQRFKNKMIKNSSIWKLVNENYEDIIYTDNVRNIEKIQMNMNVMARVNNMLIKENDTNEEVALDSFEINLIQNIENLNLNNIIKFNELQEEINKYLDLYKINAYKNRREILKNFITKTKYFFKI
jgi:hypothetical protein